MAVAFAPFDDMDPGPMGPPRVVKPVGKPAGSTSDNTECNYLVIFFIVGVFVMALTD
jgi:hypothetical protein